MFRIVLPTSLLTAGEFGLAVGLQHLPIAMAGVATTLFRQIPPSILLCWGSKNVLYNSLFINHT
mgnify:CR=1